MGILEVAQTAQTQLDKLCAETGLPASEVHIVVFTAKPVGWAIKFRLKQFDNLFMQPSSELEVTEDGTVVVCFDNDELLRRDEFINACRARVAELAPPEPSPFDAEQTIKDAGGWMVPDNWQVLAVGTACDALVKDGAHGEIKRRFDGSEAVVTVGMIVNPRSIVQGTTVLAVLPRGVLVCVDPDDLREGRNLEPYFVTWVDGEKHFMHFDTLDDAVRAAVALAVEGQP